MSSSGAQHGVARANPVVDAEQRQTEVDVGTVTDQQWALDCLTLLKHKVTDLVAKGELDPGIGWLLRTNQRTQALVPGAITVPQTLGLSEEHTQKFHSALGRKFKQVLETAFGDGVHLEKYSNAWAVIFVTNGMDDNLKSTAKHRIATTEMVTFELDVFDPPQNDPESSLEPPSTPDRPIHSSAGVTDGDDVDTNWSPSRGTRSRDRSLNFHPSPAKKIKYINTSRYHELKTKDPEYVQHIGDKTMVHGMYVAELPTKTQMTKLRKLAEIGQAVRNILVRQHTGIPERLKGMVAAVSATNPQIASAKIEMLLTMGRFSLMSELPYVNDFVAEENAKRHKKDRETLIEMVQNGTPSTTSVERYVEKLAVQQAVIKAYEVQGKNVYFQEDGGHDGQDVKFVTYWDGLKVVMFLIDVDTAPKTSKGVAEGVKYSLKKIGCNNLAGVTCDSGAGTPESLRDALCEQGLLMDDAFAESCGLHDLMSCFRLPVETYIGTGGIDKRNGIQIIHQVWDLFKHFRRWEGSTWTNLCERLWTDVYGDTRPQSELKWLIKNIQEPLLTRWWTIGQVAAFLLKFWDIIIRVAWCVRNDTGTKDAENKIAQGMISMMGEKALKFQVAFLAQFCVYWLNPHMRFYQGEDIFVKKPGFLCFHRAVRYFIMASEIEHIIDDGWQSIQTFAKAKDILAECSAADQTKLQLMAKRFFPLVLKQIHKHNKRYVVTGLVVRTCFGEKEIGRVVSKILLDQYPTNEEMVTFQSVVHGQEIDTKKLKYFLNRLLTGEDMYINGVQRHGKFQLLKEDIKAIANGADIWNDDQHKKIRIRALQHFAAQPSTTHHVERGVKLGARAKQTGKSEMKTSINVLASNAFREFSRIPYEDIEGKDDDDDGETDQEGAEDLDKDKRKRIRSTIRKDLKMIVEKVDELNFRTGGYNLMEGAPQEAIDQRKKFEQDVSEAVVKRDQQYLASRSTAKLLAVYQEDAVGEPELNIEKRTGWDLAPEVDGKIRFGNLRAKHHTKDLLDELRKREDMPSTTPAPTFTILKERLKANERKLLKEQNKELSDKDLDELVKYFTPQSDALFSIVE